MGRMKEPINIVMCSSDEYSVHCGTLIISILKNSKKDECFDFYIFESNISLSNKNKLNQIKRIKHFNIEFIKIDINLFNDECFTKRYSHLPQIQSQTFYKYLIPERLSNIDKVLYLDIDTLVLKSLSDLYNTDLTEKYAAVVKNNDTYASINKINIVNYFNAGVILYNLKKCREDNISKKLFQNHITLFKANKLQFVDQCVFNYTFQENVVLLDLKFNVGTQWVKNKDEKSIKALKNPAIVHFTTHLKPWDIFFYHPYSELYFHYLKFSPFKEQKKEIFKLYKKHKNKKYEKHYKVIKKIYSFIKSYFLFPWYVYKTYKLIKEGK